MQLQHVEHDQTENNGRAQSATWLQVVKVLCIPYIMITGPGNQQHHAAYLQGHRQPPLLSSTLPPPPGVQYLSAVLSSHVHSMPPAWTCSISNLHQGWQPARKQVHCATTCSVRHQAQRLTLQCAATTASTAAPASAAPLLLPATAASDAAASVGAQTLLRQPGAEASVGLPLLLWQGLLRRLCWVTLLAVVTVAAAAGLLLPAAKGRAQAAQFIRLCLSVLCAARLEGEALDVGALGSLCGGTLSDGGRHSGRHRHLHLP